MYASTTCIAASSLRPMRRMRISSAAARVSKLQPAPVLTRGIGIVQPCVPTSTIALSPVVTTLWLRAHAARKFVRSSADVSSIGMNRL